MPDFGLLIDRRDELKDIPGIHIILIGVSEYDFLPSEDEGPGYGFKALLKLQTGAVSAVKICHKLIELDAANRLYCPIKTLRILLAPSEIEKPLIDPDVLAKAGPADIATIGKAMMRWRKDATGNEKDQTLFYYCGHGLSNAPSESIMLASDFLDDMVEPKMRNTFQLANILDGMVPNEEQKSIAATQFYFVDSCRDRPEALGNAMIRDPGLIFEPKLGITDYRTTPVFFSTFPGSMAIGLAGKPTPFAEALIWALDNGCEVQTWIPELQKSGLPVTPQSLRAAVKLKMPNATDFQTTNKISASTLCFVESPPNCDVRVSIVPDKFRNEISKIHFCNCDGITLEGKDYSLKSDPTNFVVRVGVFRFEAEFLDGQKAKSRSNPEQLTVGRTEPVFIIVG